MAWNLLNPMHPDANTRQGLAKKYIEERDAMARMELITELSRMDDAQTVDRIAKDAFGGEGAARARAGGR